MHYQNLTVFNMNNRIGKKFCCVRSIIRGTVSWGLMVATLTACAHFSRRDSFEAIAARLGYSSQKRIVEQGYSLVATSKGNFSAVYFGYDRNGDYGPSYPEGTRQGLDVVELKLLSADGGWIWPPFMLFVDDDFDGFADRAWVDTDFNGVMEERPALEGRHIRMDRIDFRSLSPWPIEPGPVPLRNGLEI
jgi:hypothetical protein